jgi:oxidase EvaA
VSHAPLIDAPPVTADDEVGRMLAWSAATETGVSGDIKDFHRFIAQRRWAVPFEERRIPFDALRQWSFDDETGNLRHDSGRFFTVEGLEVTSDSVPGRQWSQPIINQPEIGVLGILVKEFDGVLHCLMQAKMEPGNLSGVQLSPSVQATRSNYSAVHRGRQVPLLEYFMDPARGRPLADVLQSEQGAWFYRKRNRNMVVQVFEDVPVGEDFYWLTIGQLRRLMLAEDLVNMDTRTVFACLPFDRGMASGDRFRDALARSLDPHAVALHRTAEVRSWFTGVKTFSDLRARRIPLSDVARWHRDAYEIAHEDGKYFTVIAIEVSAGNREVPGWTQPLIAPRGQGVLAFLAKRFGGVLHLLTHARVEPGYHDLVELAPTVQCTPANYQDLAPEDHPPFLDEVLTAPPSSIRYDCVQSEEGGRFYRARNRYMVVEVDHDVDVPQDYLWLTLHQLSTLAGHSHYLNVQARSLVACLHSLW